jgi:hypothetical protein
MGMSFQVYTLESRVAFAGWTQANIDNYKGPTPEVVSGLAENVRQKLGSTYTVCEVRSVHLRSKRAIIGLGINPLLTSLAEWNSRSNGRNDQEQDAVSLAPSARLAFLALFD